VIFHRIKFLFIWEQRRRFTFPISIYEVALIVNLLAALGVPDWIWDAFVAILTILFVIILIRIISLFRKRGIIQKNISSKLFTMFTGPLFVVCWLFFSGGFYSRYMAAVLPGLLILLYILVCLGSIRSKEFKNTISPDGTAIGLLKVPLLYALFMVFAALYLWYVPLDSLSAPIFTLFIPTALLIFGPLAGGSSFASLIHHHYGKYRFKVLTEKTIEGSLAMFFFSLLFTFGLLGIYWIFLGQIFNSFSIPTLILPIFIVSGVTTIIELLSPENSDVVLIPLAAFFTIFVVHLLGFYPYLVVFPFRLQFIP
jgi:phytol kinase